MFQLDRFTRLSASRESSIVKTNGKQVLLPDAQWDDLDSHVIQFYRTLRAKVRSQADELQVADEEMLYALRLVSKQEDEWRPNVAGLLWFGKTLALRRLPPSVRVTYRLHL